IEHSSSPNRHEVSRMDELLLVNGPNLGRLGRRRPDIYGADTLDDIAEAVAEEVTPCGWRVRSVQSNSEGELIDAIENAYGTVGAVVNPGALMMAGWSLRDALADYPSPWIEVHLSNVWAREPFRHQSVLSPLASGVIVGLGPRGYRLAARALVDLVPQQRPPADRTDCPEAFAPSSIRRPRRAGAGSWDGLGRARVPAEP